MTLLRRYRRFWALFALAILALPAAIQLIQPGSGSERSQEEGRELAPLPQWPRSAANWTDLPGAMDAYLDDHFGGRQWALAAHSRLLWRLRSPTSPRVTYGEDGWLFLTDSDVFAQTTGQRVRRPAIRWLVDLLGEMSTRLAQQGSQLFAAVAPNKHGIYPEMLPRWAQTGPAPTEYDFFLSQMTQAGLASTDIRIPLRSAASGSRVYFRTDTHWNTLGALIAFNSVAEGAGKGQWVLDPDETLGPIHSRRGGDLARLLRLDEVLSDEDRRLLAPPERRKEVKIDDHKQAAYEAAGSGERGVILVIGDSFTRSHFRPHLTRVAERVVWTHAKGCTFDWSLIDRYQPDLVLFLIVERSLAECYQNRPEGMPAKR